MLISTLVDNGIHDFTIRCLTVYVNFYSRRSNSKKLSLLSLTVYVNFYSRRSGIENIDNFVSDSIC